MKETLLTRLFPVPKILRTDAFGFDLSSESAKIIKVNRKGKKLHVTKWAEDRLPSGIIHRGVVENPGKLVKFLVDMKNKYNIEEVALSIPEEKAYVFNMIMPYVDKADIRGSLELSLEEHVPLPAENTVFGYETMSYNKKVDELTVHVAALPRNVVETYLSLFKKAGIAVIVLDVDANSTARAVVPKKHNGVLMIVDFGQTRTSLAIVQDGTVSFTSVLDFGGDDITKAIMKDFNVDYKEAENIKIKKGIIHNPEKDIFATSISTLSVLKDEINKYINLWNSRVAKDKEKKSEITSIIFCGGGSALTGLPGFLSSYLDLPFEIANVWRNVFELNEEVPPIHKRISLQYASAIGLSIHPHILDE